MGQQVSVQPEKAEIKRAQEMWESFIRVSKFSSYFIGVILVIVFSIFYN